MRSETAERSSSLVSQREVGRCVRSAALRQSVQVISASVVCRQQQSPIDRPRSEPLKILNITLNLHILYILYTNCAALRVQDSWRRTSSTPQNKVEQSCWVSVSFFLPQLMFQSFNSPGNSPKKKTVRLHLVH